jgi:hypothetical protein
MFLVHTSKLGMHVMSLSIRDTLGVEGSFVGSAPHLCPAEIWSAVVFWNFHGNQEKDQGAVLVLLGGGGNDAVAFMQWTDGVRF